MEQSSDVSKLKARSLVSLILFLCIVKLNFRFRDFLPYLSDETSSLIVVCDWLGTSTCTITSSDGRRSHNSCPLLPNMADTRLYEILGVTPNASDVEIKKVNWVAFQSIE